jgi:hypothetical protein
MVFMQSTVFKYVLFPAIIALLLHLNYESGFIPEKDFWTIAEIVAAMIGFDIAKIRNKDQNSESDKH